mmetsp:Transcript_5899/g.16848  ORF Transcript_5899/g.16848 Transcript_5899/m.16848 type:complete len:205 (+) Transcript_5899:1211-1825(+)
MYFASPRSVGGGCRNHVDVAMVASRLAEGHEALEGDRLFALGGIAGGECCEVAVHFGVRLWGDAQGVGEVLDGHHQHVAVVDGPLVHRHVAFLPDAGDQLHVSVGVAEAEPAAVHRLPSRQGSWRGAVRRRIHKNLPPLEHRAMQLKSPLHTLLRRKLHVPEALQLSIWLGPPSHIHHFAGGREVVLNVLLGAVERQVAHVHAA